MANERIPEDPYRSGPGGDDLIRSSRYDRELPPLDRDLDDTASSGGKVALFAVAIALVLGAVFYGLNNTSTHQAANPPPAQTAQSPQGLPQSPPGTPRANTQPGTTTGAAPSQQTMPPTAPSTMNRQPSGEAPKQ